MNSYRVELRYYSGAYAPYYIKAANQEAAWQIAHSFITPYDGVREIVVERIAAKKVKVWADVDALIQSAKSRWHDGQKQEQMDEAIKKVLEIIKITSPQIDARISYVRVTDESIEDFSDWERRIFGIRVGDERILVGKAGERILYALNVSGNSVMRSIADLTDRLAGKGW